MTTLIRASPLVLFEESSSSGGDVITDIMDQIVGGCFPVLIGFFLVGVAGLFTVLKIYQTIFH